MIRTLFVALACVVPLLAESKDEFALRKTFESLQGNWAVKSMTVAGTSVDPASVQSMRYTFESSRMIETHHPEEAVRLNIDVSGRIPQMEFLDRYGDTRTGVIQRSGETILMCWVKTEYRVPPLLPPLAPPTSFKSTKDNKAVLMELTPVKQ